MVRLTYIMESWRGYEIPSDRRESLYDFYVLDALSYVTNRHGLALHDEKSVHNLEDARSSVIGFLRDTLLKEVYRAITMELRHVSWQFDKKKLQSRVSAPLIKDMIKRSHSKERAIQRSSHLKDRREFIIHAVDTFSTKGGWSSQYGGKAWAQIASGWLRLFDAKTIDDQSIAIDHILDLQHNNGSVLSKFGVYYSVESKQQEQDRGAFNESKFWLDDFLDEKRDAVQVEHLLHGCSPYVQRLARRIIFTRTGHTVEDVSRPIVVQLRQIAKTKGVHEAAIAAWKELTKQRRRGQSQYFDEIYELDERHDPYKYLKEFFRKDAEYAYRYCRMVNDVSNNTNTTRWPEAEPYIAKHPRYAYLYYRDVLDLRRWLPAESAILKGPYAHEYIGDMDVGWEVEKRMKDKVRANRRRERERAG